MFSIIWIIKLIVPFRQRWKWPSIFQTQMLPSQRHLNQTLDRWNVVSYIVTIKKILICPIGFINVHNKKVTNSSDSQTRERRREHTDPVTIDLNIIDWTQISQNYADDMCVYIKSTMCKNSSGPLQLPTIPVTGHSIHRFRKFPVPTYDTNWLQCSASYWTEAGGLVIVSCLCE